MPELKELKNKYKNEDIYVLGSGASLSYVDKEFFNNKIVICVNYTINNVADNKNKYVVAKEPAVLMQDLAHEKSIPLISCKYNSGCVHNAVNNFKHPEEAYVFDIEPLDEYKVLDPDQDSYLYVSASTITTAIHLAAFMGAKNIVLVGHDCGVLDEKVHVDDYEKSTAVTPERTYFIWMRGQNIELKTRQLKIKLKEIYNVNVYSLNPFVSFNLDGHKYEAFGNVIETPELSNHIRKIKGAYRNAKGRAMPEPKLKPAAIFEFRPNPPAV